MKKIILAGNAITAQILYGYLSKDARYSVVAATVDDEFANQNGIPGLETVALSTLKNRFSPNDHSVVMSMGYSNINQSRQSMFIRLKELGFKIETYLHPKAQIYTDIEIGEGSIVLPSAVIEPHARVGANSMIWANVTIAHHSIVGDHCWVASGTVVSGQAKVGNNCFVGVNATIVNQIVVGEYCLIGAGALITKDTKPSTVHLARSGEEIRFSSQDYVKFIGVR